MKKKSSSLRLKLRRKGISLSKQTLTLNNSSINTLKGNLGSGKNPRPPSLKEKPNYAELLCGSMMILRVSTANGVPVVTVVSANGLSAYAVLPLWSRSRAG
ncbi:hypothetical protein Sjap_026085 [Stephania japonica]|uniref:Uncharacterized protein n=1 Tax=Stephania japonica TaxID=461633 RepID=A0AAP0EAR6_9MAGN